VAFERRLNILSHDAGFLHGRFELFFRAANFVDQCLSS
jgi:hypothetical protein